MQVCRSVPSSPKPIGPQVSEDASLPRAIAIIRQVEENRSDGNPCLDLLVELRLGFGTCAQLGLRSGFFLLSSVDFPWIL